MTSAARNPHAAAILAAAADQSAKREARLAADPKASAGHKRKPGQVRKFGSGPWDEGECSEGLPCYEVLNWSPCCLPDCEMQEADSGDEGGQGLGKGRGRRKVKTKHFGEDFVTGRGGEEGGWSAALGAPQTLPSLCQLSLPCCGIGVQALMRPGRQWRSAPRTGTTRSQVGWHSVQTVSNKWGVSCCAVVQDLTCTPLRDCRF